jgi:arylsulfatase I/J
LCYVLLRTGWANVGWHRTPNASGSDEAVTPSLNSLVAEGIELGNFRTFKYCSPSRSALQTGRNPIHVTVVNGGTDLNNPADPVSGWTGIPTNMTSIAEKLQAVGYRPHATGKWYVFCIADLTVFFFICFTTLLT